MAVIFNYVTRQGRGREVAYLNFYRNQHRDFSRSTAETKEALIKLINHIRDTEKVFNFIIQGDLNDEAKLNLGNGFREIIHDDLYHKHNDTARKKRIDRIWTNFMAVGILDILPS